MFCFKSYKVACFEIENVVVIVSLCSGENRFLLIMLKLINLKKCSCQVFAHLCWTIFQEYIHETWLVESKQDCIRCGIVYYKRIKWNTMQYIFLSSDLKVSQNLLFEFEYGHESTSSLPMTFVFFLPVASFTPFTSNFIKKNRNKKIIYPFLLYNNGDTVITCLVCCCSKWKRHSK